MREEHAEEDKKQFELVEARNKADQRVYQMEKLIEENGDKLGESDLEPVNASIEKVREAAKGDDKDAIDSAVADLEQTYKHYRRYFTKQLNLTVELMRPQRMSKTTMQSMLNLKSKTKKLRSKSHFLRS